MKPISDIRGYLSDEIDSISVRTSKLLGATKPAWIVRLHGFLVQHQTQRTGCLVLACTCLIPLGLLGFFFSHHTLPPPSNTDESAASVSSLGSVAPSDSFAGSHIETIAQVTAGIAGILLAAIVFSVQLHAQREDEGALMTRYLVKKHFVPSIAGFALGLTAFDGSILLVHILGAQWNWQVVAAIDLVGLMFLLIAAYWLIYRSILDATDSTFDIGFEPFRQDLANRVAEDSFLDDLSDRFYELLKSLKIERSHPVIHRNRPFRRGSRKDREEMTFSCPSIEGTIDDIYVPCLRELGEMLAELGRQSSNVSAELLFGPGDHLNSSPVLVLRADSEKTQNFVPNDKIADREAEVTPKRPSLGSIATEETSRDIENLLARIFVSRHRLRRSEFNDFFDRFAARLKNLAKNGDAILLGQLLEKYERILELTTADDDKSGQRSRASFSFEPRASNPLERELFDVVRLAYASNDQHTLEALSQGIRSFYYLSQRNKSTAINKWALDILAYIYRVGCSRRGDTFDRDELKENFDRLLHSIFVALSSRHAGLLSDATISDTFESERRRLDLAIAFALDVIMQAIENGREIEADIFTDRLFEYREHSHPQLNNYDNAPTCETVDTLHDYALIVLVGWCLEFAHSCVTDTDIKTRIYKRVREISAEYGIGLAPTVAVWELYHQSDQSEEIDHRLGIARLDFDSTSRRIGKVYSSFGRPDWQKRGALCLLLLAKEDSEFAKDNFFTGPPVLRTWDVDRDKEMLSSIASVLAIPNSEGRIDSVVSMLKQRRFSAEKQALLKVANCELDELEIESFRKDALTAWTGHRQLVNFLDANSGNGDISQRPKATQLSLKLPVEAFQTNNSWSGFGAGFGEDLAGAERIVLLYAVEEAVQCFSNCVELSELEAQILLAARALQGDGFAPNAIFIPRNARFASALFRRPSWQTRSDDRGVFQDLWNGMRVIQWPYIDPSSVVVADLRSLFTKVSPSPKPEMKFDLPTASLREGFINSIEKSDSLDDLPESHSLVLTAKGSVNAALGIAESQAATKISLDNSDAMYVIVEDSDRYHRPTCSAINGKAIIKRTLAPRSSDPQEDRVPCDVCKSAQWDFEARRGEH